MEQLYTKFASVFHWSHYSIRLQPKMTRLTDDQLQQLRESKNDEYLSSISLHPAAIARILAMVVVTLICVGFATQAADYLTGYSSSFLHKVDKIFSLDIEHNVPSYFSELLLLFATGLLALITILKWKRADFYQLEWTILALGFLFMAFDETAQIHEKLIEPMRSILGEKNLGVFYYAWVVPAIVLLLFLSLFFCKFLWNLPSKTRLAFLVGGVVYIAGAVGMELVGGSYAETHGRENLIYIAFTTIEESLEMLGIVIFIWALLDYIAANFKEIEMRFGSGTNNIEAADIIVMPQETSLSQTVN